MFNKTKPEQQIIDQLDQICALLGPLTSTCDAIVAQYVPQMIQWIINGEDPKTFCTQVGLCSARPDPKLEKREALQAGCSICTMIVGYVESYLAQNQTQQQIIEQLDQLCALLGPLASQCDAFVAAYVPQLIQWIQKTVNPHNFSAHKLVFVRPTKFPTKSTNSTKESLHQTIFH